MKNLLFWGIAISIILSNGNSLASSAIGPRPEIKINIEKEWKGYRSGYTEPKRLVISTLEEWEEVWKNVHSLVIPRPELPEIDFGKEMVIAVFMGERNSGGYEVEIIKIVDTGEEIVIKVKEKELPLESFQTMALTQPYHIVVIKKYTLPVSFGFFKSQ
ncbi:MAG: protease complex subunit PrcB family protein [Candidatus Omnitrophica bacterium]|nr:protease complex subunit PrcB family protein [Candidatus Omnitrophota bacterium]